MDNLHRQLKLKGDPSREDTAEQVSDARNGEDQTAGRDKSPIQKAKEGAKPVVRESHFVFVLAVIIISVFLINYSIVLFYDKDKNYAGLEKLTSTLGPIVAAVIGYYFGQRPTEALTERAEQATEKKDKTKEEAMDALRKLDEAEQELKNYRQNLLKLNKAKSS